MNLLFERVSDLRAGADVLARRPFGVIEMAGGKLASIQLRPWPKVISLLEAFWGAAASHRRAGGDRCWLYYNQPWSCPNYLALKYVVSNRGSLLQTFHGALVVLDEIARLKGADAIVCHVTNSRISDRLLRRWGWERHVLDSPRRHYIKRFYGRYPRPSAAWRLCDASFAEAESHKPLAADSALAPFADFGMVSPSNLKSPISNLRSQNAHGRRHLRRSFAGRADR